MIGRQHKIRMDLLRSGIKSVLGAPQPGGQPSGAETVEKLVDRLETSTLLEDRRDACRALKAMSRPYRVEVGAQGMSALIRALQNDSHDAELVGYALDSLCNVCAPEPLEEEPAESAVAHLGEQFTEIFIKQLDRVPLVISLLEEFDFRVRWPAVKLLTSLLANKPREIQEMVLVSPMGVSKLMDLLSDSREIIRNDVLLLLTQLTKGNANIQKIVAFENAFDRIFDVIKDEGFADGGIIVQDCLLLMLNLLRNNTSNMNFFKEGSYIQRLGPMLTLPSEEEETEGWTAQRVANTHCLLQVVRALVSPSNPGQVTSSCQKLMKHCGLLESLCSVLMATGVPADVLTETINTVAEVIRGNFSNQEYFAGVLAPSDPPRPAIVVLLMSMENEKQPFVLRCAVLYSFQCFLYKNEFGQAQLIQTLLPSPADMSVLTSGKLLCGGLFNSEPLNNWFSAVALSHGICENPVEKETLLKVRLATSPGSAPVSLLHQCSILIQQTNKLQTKVGILMLLSVWLSHSPLAVAQFLSVPSSVPFLTAQAGSTENDEGEELIQGLCAFLMGICIHFNDNSVPSFTKDNLAQIVVKRIGLEVFVDKLGSVSKHEQYSQAAKHPQIRPSQPDKLLLDYEFCRLFKALEGLVCKSVSPSDVPDSVLVMQYKDIIREQDKRLQELATDLARLRINEAAANARVAALEAELTLQKDENVLLRACAGDARVVELAAEVTKLKADGASARALIEALQSELSHQREQNSMLRSVNADSKYDELAGELSRLKTEEAESRVRADNLQADLHRLQAQPSADPSDNGQLSRLQVELFREREGSSRMAQEIAHLRGELGRAASEAAAERDRATRAEARVAELEVALPELEKLRSDQDDLLVLLADQDHRLTEMKARLRALGEKVEDDDSEEDHSLSQASS